MTARRRTWTQLGVGLGVSVGLHAAVLSGLRPVQPSDSAPPTMSVRLLTAFVPEPAVSAAPIAPRAPLAAVQSHRAGPVRSEPLLGVLTEFAASDFAAADSLIQRPSAVGDVVVRYPEGLEAPARVQVRLTLFIDERGDVVRVQADNSDVPGGFVEAARATFGVAKFAPGLALEGPVKSRLRVEVSFDSGERP